MRFARLTAEVRRLLDIPRDNVALLQAKYEALARMIPIIYLVVVLNSWLLAATFLHTAPIWLTVLCPLLLTAACLLRLATWWHRRSHQAKTPTNAYAALVGSGSMALLLSIGFSAWVFVLFPYGDAYAHGHAVLFLVMTVIVCISCLMHLRAAGCALAIVPCIVLLLLTYREGPPALMLMAIDSLLLTAVMLVVSFAQNGDFSRMVAGRTQALQLIEENRLREQEQHRLLRMIEDMPVAVMTIDPETYNINYLNDATKVMLRQIEHLLPVKVDELLGTCIDIFHKHPEHQRKVLADPARLPYRTRIRLGPEVIDAQISPVYGTDGRYMGPMLTWALVTQHVEAERRILQLAHYDTLTGLANRTTFRHKLESSLTRQGCEMGVLFIDLDGFKIINDSKGHMVGDLLLRQVADRLRVECNYPGITVGRLGGDEFAVLIENCTPERQTHFAGTLIHALTAPYSLDSDMTVQVGASIGVACAPLHGGDPETLLSRADIALYAAKAAGKGNFQVFSEDMESRIQDRMRLESRLRAALDDGHTLQVFYQPIVDIQTRRVTAREALVRWQDPERGWIPPAEFIPVAEHSGLIDRLGSFVLRRACHDAAGWEDGARVAVNVSAGQLGKGALLSMVEAALAESGFAPQRLEVEVTETALLNDVLDCVADLRAVRALGVRVALDDFGTGFSSLAHLRAFPFDKIKIDGSFVQDAVLRPDCAAVVKAVADLGKRLGVTTVAEGVETAEHLERVALEGCSEVQGFLFGRPAPNDPTGHPDALRRRQATDARTVPPPGFAVSATELLSGA